MAQPDITLYRVAAGIWLPIVIIAALWAAGGDSLSMHAYWLVMPLVLLAATLTPNRLYHTAFRYWLALLYALGLATVAAAIFHDYRMSFGPDYVAIVLRGTQAIILVALIKYAVAQGQARHAA